MALREVDFFNYCPKCKNKNKSEQEDPCYECLETSVKDDSRKPEFFEEE